MKEAILKAVSVSFLGLGFLVAEKPILSVGCFLVFAILGCICVVIEDNKERNIFKK